LLRPTSLVAFDRLTQPLDQFRLQEPFEKDTANDDRILPTLRPTLDSPRASSMLRTSASFAVSASLSFSICYRRTREPARLP
jgi:hypothetical protein